MKLLDRRYVYLMIRTRENEARMIIYRRMMNAQKVEKTLHRIFAGSRFDIKRNIKYNRWLQNHVKIGIARRPHSRLRQVNENIFGSGHTEWFALNGLELLLLKAWLYWFSVRVYFLILVVFVMTMLSYQL